MHRVWIGLADDAPDPSFVQLQIYPDSPYKLYLVTPGTKSSVCSLLERFASMAEAEGHSRVHLTVPRFQASSRWRYGPDAVGWAGRLVAFLTVDRFGIDRTEVYRGPIVKHGAHWDGREVNVLVVKGASWFLVRDTDRLVLLSGRI